MKRLFYILVLVLLFSFNATVVFADERDEQRVINEKIESILPTNSSPSAETLGGQSSRVGDILPTADLKTQIVPKAISIALALVGSVSFIVFVYAGVMLVLSQGNEEEITKFKNVLIWSLVGLVFITVSYALVRGIMQISFT